MGRHEEDGWREDKDEEGRYRVRRRVRQQQDYDEEMGGVREGPQSATAVLGFPGERGVRVTGWWLVRPAGAGLPRRVLL